MKDIVPPPPAIVRNEFASVRQLFEKNVVPTYGRFELAFTHGAGSCLYDVNGKRYLDFGAGIAVCGLGHAHPEITAALVEQSKRLVHVSNLYYHAPQGQLAEAIVQLTGPGKCFFSNSGAEANEALFKLARRFGHDEGRFEILTAFNSFHGRTLAGIAATGQEKFRKNFGPAVPGFRHVPFNDFAALEQALSPATVAILLEPIQGESGITPATADYLLRVRDLCTRQKLLLLLDEVQAGYFRTGRFHSYQRLLEGVPGAEDFLPDGVSMAKSLGGGFPIGAAWMRNPYADLMGPGSHASTFGGTPLGCAVALKVLEVVRREDLAGNARRLGDWMLDELRRVAAAAPQVIREVRGIGLMIGIQLAAGIPAFAGQEKTPAAQFVNRLHAAGLLTIPAGNDVVRLLPPLNLSQAEAKEGIQIIEKTAKALQA